MDINDLELFRAGVYPQGTFTVADLHAIADSYDPTWHEAPACVGHGGDPELPDGAPAVGWVRRLRVDGDRLLGDLRDVPEHFAGALRAGTWKKRSAAFYRSMPMRDGRSVPYLRHLAWVPIPQVKGMADPVLPPAEPDIFGEGRSAGTFPAAGAVCEVTMEDAGMAQEDTTRGQADGMSVPFPAQRQPEGADRCGGRMEHARLTGAFFDELVRDGRLTPAQAAVEEELIRRIAGSAEFGESEAALLTRKREELEARPASAQFASTGMLPGERRKRARGRQADTRADEDWLANEAVYRKLGVREESVKLLARREAGI